MWKWKKRSPKGINSHVDFLWISTLSMCVDRYNPVNYQIERIVSERYTIKGVSELFMRLNQFRSKKFSKFSLFKVAFLAVFKWQWMFDGAFKNHSFIPPLGNFNTHESEMWQMKWVFSSRVKEVADQLKHLYKFI